MGRSKKLKYEQNTGQENIIEPGKSLFGDSRGKWQQFFGNNYPIVLELACGRGEYTVGLAQQHPERNYIGIDIKGDRIWKGSKAATEAGLNNVAFLRIMIQELEQHFAPGEVSEIWIIHPDPRPKNRDIKRRLTSERYLRIYQRLLRPGGKVHLKTDDTPLFEFSIEELKKFQVEELEQTTDLYNSPLKSRHFGIKTRYESKFTELGRNIKYCSFSFKPLPPIEVAPATDADLPAVHALVKALAVSVGSPDGVKITEADVQKAYKNKQIQLMVAKVAGDIAGMALYFSSFSSWRGPMLYLEDLVVDKQWRGRGIGSQLAEAFLAEAKVKGYAVAGWQVLESNKKAQLLYRRVGAEFHKGYINCRVDVNEPRKLMPTGK